jgi:hypothetical protein
MPKYICTEKIVVVALRMRGCVEEGIVYTAKNVGAFMISSDGDALRVACELRAEDGVSCELKAEW